MTEPARELVGRALAGLAAEVRACAARLAADGDGDAEAVHDFRVALRRLRTLLRAGRALFGERRLRAIGDALAAVADATGALRDEEVLRATLEALEVGADTRAALGAFLEARRRGEPARRATVIAGICAAHEGGGRLAPAVAEPLDALERRLARPLRAGEASPDAARFARAALRRAIDDIAARARDDVGDALAMHALRIRWKRLRYTAELFEAVLGERVAAAAKAAAKMQKRLGDLHDLDEALARVAPSRAIAGPARRDAIAALRLARARTAVRCLEDLARAEAVIARLAPDLAGDATATAGAPPSPGREPA